MSEEYVVISLVEEVTKRLLVTKVGLKLGEINLQSANKLWLLSNSLFWKTNKSI